MKREKNIDPKKKRLAQNSKFQLKQDIKTVELNSGSKHFKINHTSLERTARASPERRWDRPLSYHSNLYGDESDLPKG